MNSSWMDEELANVDQEPESWSDMLTNMFDGEVEVIDISVNDGEEIESMNIFK